MGIVVDRHQGPPPAEREIAALMRSEGLVLPSHSPHAATVSAEGVRCLEASRSG